MANLRNGWENNFNTTNIPGSGWGSLDNRLSYGSANYQFYFAEDLKVKRYDSTKDTLKHIKRVKFYIKSCVKELHNRTKLHDRDKIHNVIEKALFDEFTPKLKYCTYGSDEYNLFLNSLKSALDIHYSINRHHPEHFANGINGMNLIDVLEMICDWKAASERHADGDIFRSIEINQNRFGYSDDLKNILINTAIFLNDRRSLNA